MNMDVIENASGVTRAVLNGRFDIAGALEVDLPISVLAGRCKILVVDLAGVTFLASMGVRTLMLSAKTMMRRGATMAVCGADSNVETVLRLTGFDEIVTLYPDFETAEAKIAGAAS
jgi:anti-anti-sigma factor